MPKQYASPPAMTIDPKKTYRAVMNTSKGAIAIDLFADRAPITVNNFVFLARDGFYDWRHLPPCSRWLYGAGRRPHRQRARRTRLSLGR